MDYEKKYKEALGWMQSIYDGLHDATKEDAEHYFPELKESKDEKVRKAILELVKQSVLLNPMIQKSMISWLEKQGEQQHTNSKDDERLKKTTVAFLKDFAEQGYENAVECIDWLEKQGKQKTEIEYIYPKFRIGDVIEQIQPNGNSQPVRVLSISKKIQSYCCESDDHNVYSSIPIRCENEYKLVEQKPTKWSEHQHKLLNYAISMTDDAEVKCFLKSLRNTSSNTSTDWSEEDEKLYTSALWHIKNSCSNGGKDSGEFEVYNWLKSIKDRVQPQPKQEWSEEDSVMMNLLIEELNSIAKHNGCLKQYEPEINWLKSLKPNNWKPSEFQLECLRRVIPQPDTEIGNELECTLTELYDNLKKL